MKIPLLLLSILAGILLCGCQHRQPRAIESVASLRQLVDAGLWPNHEVTVALVHSGIWRTDTQAVLAKLQQIAETQPGALRFVHIDAQAAPAVLESFQIKDFPTVLFLDGELETVRRLSGQWPQYLLRDKIDALLESHRSRP